MATSLVVFRPKDDSKIFSFAPRADLLQCASRPNISSSSFMVETVVDWSVNREDLFTF